MLISLGYDAHIGSLCICITHSFQSGDMVLFISSSYDVLALKTESE